MASLEGKPRARGGFSTSNHVKRGRRFVTLLDLETKRVVLLEKWENAVLALADGTRDAALIAKLLLPDVDGEVIDERAVERAIALLDREGLLDFIEDKAQSLTTLPGELTATELQLAYFEWHSDGFGGLAWASPFIQPEGIVRAGLEPTVAFPYAEGEDPKNLVLNVGSTLILAEASSLLADPQARLSRSVAPAGLAVTGADAPPSASFLASGLTAGGSAALENAPRLRSALGLAPAGGEPEAQVDSPFSDGGSANIEDLLNAVDHDFEVVESREAEALQAPPEPPPAPPAAAASAPAPTPASSPPQLPNPWVPPPLPSARRPAAKPALEPEAVLVRVAEALEPGPRAKPWSSPSRPTAFPDAVVGRTLVSPPPGEPMDGEPEREETRQVSARAMIGPSDTDPSISIEREEATTLLLEPAAPAPAVVQEALTIHDLADMPTEAVVHADELQEDFRDEPRMTKWEEPARSRRRPRREPGAALRPPSPVRIRARAAGQPTTGVGAVPRVPRDRIQDPAATARARAVFERLREAGLRARGLAGEVTEKWMPRERRARRRDQTDTRLFDEALGQLSRGDVEAALLHFRRLRDKMPASARLGAFLKAIEAVGQTDGRSTPAALDDFEGALEEAVSYGRCPGCFSMLEDRALTRCFACGFAWSKSPEETGSK